MQHVIIIGGGVLGMLTARELAIAGCAVDLYDRQATGGESSWAGGGIVSPLFPWRYLDGITALANWSQQVYPAFCDTLFAATGVDSEYTNSGLLMIAPDEEDDARAWADRHRRRLARVDSTQFAALEPQAAEVPASALWMPDVGQVRNPRLVRAVRADILQRGVRVHEHQAVTGLLHTDRRCSGIHAGGKNHHADAVLVCAGAWSRELLGELPDPPDIRPVRGQMLMFRTPPGTIRRMVLEKNRYIIPRRDGRVLFGSTIEEVGFEKQTTAAARAELHQIATRRFPVLRDCPIEAHWAGLRPGSPAGMPYIGQHPQVAGLFINAGHFRNGVVLSPASARLATDLILGRPPILNPSPYAWNAPRG